jgi:trehalose 6-phosphate phosphatase
LEHLLSNWHKIVTQIEKARTILFLTDYDGTLTPIVEKPESAIISDLTRQLLCSLSQQKGFIVGVISGRTLADTKEKVNVEGLIYAGNHGFEIEGPGLNFVNPISEEIKPYIRMVRQALAMTLGTIKGVFVEDKGITLSVHYRGVEKEKSKEVETSIENAVKRPVSMGIVNVTRGKKVFELKPAVNWDKGKAIQLLMKKYGKGGRFSGLLPIYLGDDITDEDGFRAIEKYGNGITVLVGPARSESSARYYLNSSEEVQCFMSKLIKYNKRGLTCEQLSTI